MRRARDITMADTDTTWQYSEHMHADVTQTIVSSALPYSPVGITRVNTNRRHSGMTDPYEREPAYLVILQLQPFGEQELWLAGKPAPHVPYGAGWLAIYDLERNWSANLVGEYVDHMALALRTHLVQTYSGVQVPSRRVQAGLAPWQEERAKALIMAHLDGEILLETVAYPARTLPRRFVSAWACRRIGGWCCSVSSARSITCSRPCCRLARSPICAALLIKAISRAPSAGWSASILASGGGRSAIDPQRDTNCRDSAHVRTKSRILVLSTACIAS